VDVLRNQLLPRKNPLAGAMVRHLQAIRSVRNNICERKYRADSVCFDLFS